MFLHNPKHQLSLLAYTKLLAAHVNNAQHEKALVLFQSMHANPSLQLDSFVYPLALKSCSALNLPQLGISIHTHTLKSCFLTTSPFVSCALIDMYGKCVSVNLARKLFDEIPERNVVVWNSMISLYLSSNDVDMAMQLFEVIDGEPNASSFNSIIAALLKLDDGRSKALGFYRRMEHFGVKPNEITILALLHACVGVAALNLIKEIHGYSFRNEFDSRLQLSSGLIEVYGQCGCLRNARYVFERIPEKDVVAWSSMVSAYALHGEAENALSIFREMELARVWPDEIAFLGVLKACAHGGLADEALRYFARMRNYYRLEASSQHYACLVDVLGRAGRLYEAYDIIRKMPMKATAKAWGALLAACRSYKEVELAEIAGNVLFEIEPNNAANYVLLASIYAGVGRFADAERVRREMKTRGVKSLRGGSWVISHE
ncbi:Pentatricopeptide repeat-containing protein [Thalictrum thalictroides]|uniref:Pentatricopeptide repeat-containing protein n=1 Tax=Thalictrum thalictroides TaxID=46969 RepID=A0A7J6VCB9_THATH|nr:Pentatricopeptide repeat-containing protein [Thalictrum thalictroides]